MKGTKLERRLGGGEKLTFSKSSQISSIRIKGVALFGEAGEGHSFRSNNQRESASKKGRSAIEVSIVNTTFASNVDVTAVKCNSKFYVAKMSLPWRTRTSDLVCVFHSQVLQPVCPLKMG